MNKGDGVVLVLQAVNFNIAGIMASAIYLLFPDSLKCLNLILIY